MIHYVSSVLLSLIFFVANEPEIDLKITYIYTYTHTQWLVNVINHFLIILL